MNLMFRSAQRTDLATLVAMLADDELGRQRERPQLPLHEDYVEALAAINRDPNNELILAIADAGDTIAGMLQLTLTPNLTYVGSWRALIEGVRVCAPMRDQGVGRALIRQAIERARERRCRLVQLTTDKTRPDAKRFYESLGFQATHEGIKRMLA